MPSEQRSQVRMNTLEGLLFSHSAYPTGTADAVFFGPDTYRFVSLITGVLRTAPPPRAAHVLDMGCGGGPGSLLQRVPEWSAEAGWLRAADTGGSLVLFESATQGPLQHARLDRRPRQHRSA